MIRIIFNWLRSAFWQNNMASSNKKSIPVLPQVTAPCRWMHTRWYALCRQSRATIAHYFDPWMQDTGQGCVVLSSQSFNTLYFIRTTLTGNARRQKPLQRRKRGRWRPLKAAEGRCHAADFWCRSLFTWVTEANVRPPRLGVCWKVSAPPEAVYGHMSGLNLVKNVCFSDVMSER